MDLADFATELWTRLPSLADERGIVLDRETLPVPPAALTSRELVVQRGGHHYGDYLVDALGWFAAKPVLGRFALLLLASVGLPWLQLSSASGVGMAHDHERALRDTVFGFGSLEGTVRLAELLLDASRPDATQDEIELECEAGFRGVAPSSAEMTLWLPGSAAWPP